MQADGFNTTIYVPSVNNFATHSRFFFKGLQVTVKNQLSYGENEWEFYFWHSCTSDHSHGFFHLTLTLKVSVKQMMQHLVYSKMNNSHLDEWITLSGH